MELENQRKNWIDPICNLVQMTWRYALSVQGVQNNRPSLMDGLMIQKITEAAPETLRTNKPVKIIYRQPE